MRRFRLYDDKAKTYEYLDLDDVKATRQYEQSLKRKDKNKTEMFEGDRLRVTNPKGEECGEFTVEYSKEGCGYFFKYGDQLVPIGFAMELGFTVEIINRR